MRVVVLTLTALPRHLLSLPKQPLLELFLFKNNFILQSCKNSTQNSHIQFTRILQMLRNYTTMVQLSKLTLAQYY